MSVKLKWKDNMTFEGEARGHKTIMDDIADNKGPTPKELLLEAMCGCTGIDVVSTLQKMRQEIKTFEMETITKKNSEPPIYFTEVKLIYRLTGNIEKEKLIRAVNLSMTRYCGVSYIVSQTAEIPLDVYLNGEKIYSGKADFVDPEE